MVWQDIVITVANLLFTCSLLYQIYIEFKEKKGLLTFETSFITMVGSYAVAIVYVTLGLYLSTIIGLINGSLWLVLLAQKLRYKKD